MIDDLLSIYNHERRQYQKKNKKSPIQFQQSILVFDKKIEEYNKHIKQVNKIIKWFDLLIEWKDYCLNIEESDLFRYCIYTNSSRALIFQYLNDGKYIVVSFADTLLRNVAQNQGNDPEDHFQNNMSLSYGYHHFLGFTIIKREKFKNNSNAFLFFNVEEVIMIMIIIIIYR